MYHLLRNRYSLPTAIVVVLLLSAPSTYAATPTDLRVRALAASFRAGTLGRYHVTVSNRGSQATDDPVHVTFTLPAGLSLAAQLNPDWSCTATGQAVDCLKLSPFARGRASTLRLRVGVCDAAYPLVSTTFQVVYAADTDTSNNAWTRTTNVHAGHCSAGSPTPSRTPGTAATPTPQPPGSSRTPTPTSTPMPGNPNAPVVTSVTCNGATQCTVSLGQSYTVQFSFTDANNNAISWQITSRRDDGVTEPVGSGNLGTPSGSGTIPLQYPPFTCPQGPCRQTTFVFSVVVTDTTGLASAPVGVTITVRASGQ